MALPVNVARKHEKTMQRQVGNLLDKCSGFSLIKWGMEHCELPRNRIKRHFVLPLLICRGYIFLPPAHRLQFVSRPIDGESRCRLELCSLLSPACSELRREWSRGKQDNYNCFLSAAECPPSLYRAAHAMPLMPLSCHGSRLVDAVSCRHI